MSTTLTTIAAILAHTPFWVWIILLALIWRGLKATQPRETSLAKMLLFPLVLVALSASNILGSGLTNAVLAGVGIGGLLGLAAGLQLERRFAAVAIGNGRLLLAGEWTSLVIVLAVFTARYVKTVAGIVDPALAASDSFQMIMAGLSAFFSLMLLTRTALRLRVALGSPAVAA